MARHPWGAYARERRSARLTSSERRSRDKVTPEQRAAWDAEAVAVLARNSALVASGAIQTRHNGQVQP